MTDPGWASPMPLRIGTWTGRGAGYCGTSDFATSQFIHTTNRPPGSARQKIADVPSLSKAAWGATGDIIFAPSNRSPLYHLRESGGAPRQITTLNDSRTENSHRAPVFLPDGKHFLFTRSEERRVGKECR